MTKIFLVLVFVVTSLNAFALELYGVKKGATLTVLTPESFTKAWNSNQPVCIKDGSRFIGGNKAYGAKISGGKACANSPATARMNKINFGTEVTVLRVAELPESVIKELSKN